MSMQDANVMKAARKKRTRVIVTSIVLAASVVGAIFLLYSYPPMDEARVAMQSDGTVSVSDSPWYTFTPAAVNATTGLVFYRSLQTEANLDTMSGCPD